MKKFFYNYFYNSSEFRIAASFFIPLIILYQGFKQALVRVNFPALFLYAMLVVLDIALLLVRLKLSVFDKKFWAGFQKKEADYNGETVVFRQNGNIVLFHDKVYGKSPTAQALDKIIPILMERGYSLVTVSELMSV